MPTIYTEDICENDNTSVRDFIVRCLCGMGAAVTMRDEDFSVTRTVEAISKREEEHILYHQNELNKAEKSLEDWLSLSKKEQKNLLNYAVEKQSSFYDEEEVSSLRKKRNLIKIMEGILIWSPPTENHEGFKMFMLEQLKKTIDYDGTPLEKEQRINLKSNSEEEHKVLLEKHLDLCRQNLKKAKKMGEDRLTWIKQVWDSLPEE